MQKIKIFTKKIKICPKRAVVLSLSSRKVLMASTRSHHGWIKLKYNWMLSLDWCLREVDPCVLVHAWYKVKIVGDAKNQRLLYQLILYYSSHQSSWVLNFGIQTFSLSSYAGEFDCEGVLLWEIYMMRVDFVKENNHFFSPEVFPAQDDRVSFRRAIIFEGTNWAVTITG